jgi:Protein of unknown function (DUF2844)
MSNPSYPGRVPGSGQRRRGPLALVLFATCLLASPVRAGLGEAASAIAHDHRVLRGQSLTVTDQGSYRVQEIALASGTRVREYVSPQGQVFGVGWVGQELPDLQQVLASHYAQYAAAAAQRRVNHKVLIISTPGLELRVIKLPRGFAGTAHVPALVPAGVDPAAIR